MSEPRAPETAVDQLMQAKDQRQEMLGELLEAQRRRLLRMVDLRMHPGLKQRVGASDVLQDAWLEISKRLDDYLADPQMPFHLWVRFITQQRLQKAHRFHVGAQKRDVRKQVVVAARPEATSAGIVDHLEASGMTPSGVALEAEARRRLLLALDEMAPMDREVLVLRHFEELSNQDAAQELGIETSACSKRYLRAVERLRKVLAVRG